MLCELVWELSAWGIVCTTNRAAFSYLARERFCEYSICFSQNSPFSHPELPAVVANARNGGFMSYQGILRPPCCSFALGCMGTAGMTRANVSICFSRHPAVLFPRCTAIARSCCRSIACTYHEFSRPSAASMLLFSVSGLHGRLPACLLG